jgi:trans-aconitate 2-methyltransferase
MPWDPAQYERFLRERELPFADALALVGPLRERARIIDLGCGTGALTAKLADAYPTASVLGIDTSVEMLDKAKSLERPRLRFVKAAIEALDQIHLPSVGQIELDGPPTWDLVFSHAALQWVPDHARLVPRLFACVAEGGRLVVQLPSNHDSVAHRMLMAVADEAPFRDELHGRVADRPTLDVREYAALLWRSGGSDIAAYTKVYPHVLPDSDAAAEWLKGTAMIPYVERLSPDRRAPFVERYRAALRDALPDAPLFFGFKRTLFAASRSSR